MRDLEHRRLVDSLEDGSLLPQAFLAAVEQQADVALPGGATAHDRATTVIAFKRRPLRSG